MSRFSHLNDLCLCFHSGDCGRSESLLCSYQDLSLKYKQEEDLLHVADMSENKQVQDNNDDEKKKKKPPYLQLVLAGVKYGRDTERDGERNEMKDPWRRVHLTFRALALSHSGVLL